MQILLQLDWIVTFKIHANFRRMYVESPEQNSAYISPPICSNRLIFNFPETNMLENEGKEKFYWTWREDQN